MTWPRREATVTRERGRNGLERSPLAATRFVSLDAEVQETQSGAQASAFAYRDERDRDRWAAPCRVTTASDFIRDDAKCTTWQR